ncbi:MAG: hypothetical protein MK209_01450, partial [Planctomycetes bacterium]|nr:hypothetical protein [Planctomycetota bacterium]
MSARFFGRLALLLIVLVLVVDVLRNLPSEPKPLGESPDGFPWPTRGLGEISLGMEGRFLLDLEERTQSGEGVQRVPQMSLAGTDPRPHDGGMVLREAEIRSFGETAQRGMVRVQVNAPEAWVPMSLARDGSRELDRTQPWRFKQPVVALPRLGGVQDFILEADSAELDPISNEVYCPGPFILRSSSLRFRGRGLRLTPETSSVCFGELDGHLSWELALPEGGRLRGAPEGGGELGLLSKTEALLIMRAYDQCWVELPEEAGLPGRLETSGLRLSLFTPAQGGIEEEENAAGSGARWAPRHLDGEGRTFWSSASQTLSGGTSAVDWDKSGDLLGLLIDGPILAHSLGSAAGWNTAQGGAHLDAGTGALNLWDRVIARTMHASVHADRARVDGEENLFAQGQLVVTAAQGLSFANNLESSREEENLWLAKVVSFPSAPEVRRVQAPRMRVSADQSAEIPAEFVLSGELEGQVWSFKGASLSSWLDSVDRQVVVARGGVRGLIDKAAWAGETLSLRESRFVLKGSPCSIELPLETGDAVVAHAETATLAFGSLRLSGGPRVRVPAALLGLAGDFVTVSAHHVVRDADGRWTFDRDVRFDGSCLGGARRMEWWPNGYFRVERDGYNDALVAQLEDGSVAHVHARLIEHQQGGQLRLSSELDLRLRLNNKEPEVRVEGARAELRADGGTIEGPVTFTQGERKASAQRVEWEGDPAIGPYVVYLTGNASFDAPEGSGKA